MSELDDFVIYHMPMIYIEVGDDVLRSYRATTAPRIGEYIWLSRPARLRLRVEEVVHRFSDDPTAPPAPETVHVICRLARSQLARGEQQGGESD